MLVDRNLLEECVCLRLRKSARAVTRAYDEALRPTGLRATQLSVLVGVASERGTSIAFLSRSLGMDRSTLTRNIRPLLKSGLVTLGPEGWHRSRVLDITRQGTDRLMKAFPLWKEVQQQLRQKFGNSRWLTLRTELMIWEKQPLESRSPSPKPKRERSLESEMNFKRKLIG